MIYFVPCSDLSTRNMMWVEFNNLQQVSVSDAVTISQVYADRYAEDYKPVFID